MNAQNLDFDISKIKAIVGLGNPGMQYSKTRHNVGFRFLDWLAKENNIEFKSAEEKEVAQLIISNEEPVKMVRQAHHERVLQSVRPEPVEGFERDRNMYNLYLVKPLTFMNNSGKAFSFLLKKGIKPEHILVVHDELEKAFGAINLKLGGSAKGHNGLRSIINTVGPDFWRVQIGIGRPADKLEVGNYVLTNFTKDEEAQLPAILEKINSTLLKH